MNGDRIEHRSSQVQHEVWMLKYEMRLSGCDHVLDKWAMQGACVHVCAWHAA